jgi:hypothetical protein
MVPPLGYLILTQDSKQLEMNASGGSSLSHQDFLQGQTGVRVSTAASVSSSPRSSRIADPLRFLLHRKINLISMRPAPFDPGQSHSLA